MTNKVQKIREEVERLYNQSLADENRQADRGLKCAANVSYGKSKVCKELLSFIDSLQEEPKFKTGDRIKPIDSCLGSPRTIVDICDSWYVTDQGTLDFEHEDNWELTEEPVSDKFAFKAIPRLLEMIEPTDRAKAYTAKLADALEVEGYPTDAKIVRESLKIMNGEKVPMATMDEEPVSEELEEALAKEWKGYVDRGAATVDALEDNTQELTFAKGFYRGAKWQKEQDQSTIELAEDHAMLAGMEKMKEQITKDIWKPADGVGLPEYDREVIVLIKYNTQRNIHDEEYPTYRVGFGHRPNPNGWDGKNIDTNEVTHYTPKLYDKGGWNAPDIAYWLDVILPKEIEL